MSLKKSRVRAPAFPAETGVIRKSWAGRISVALCYPNLYPVAMGNLGFHQVYHLLNLHDDVVCERVVLDPAGRPALSIESGRPLADFELAAFSVSYETDLVNVAKMLELSRIPLFARDRASADGPLVMAGGVIAFLNPEPLAPFCDLIALGEAEAILPDFLSVYREHRAQDRTELLAALAEVPGLYVPAFYELNYAPDRTIRERKIIHSPAPVKVRRRIAADLGREPAGTRVFSADAEFSELALIELARGCVHACRFCGGAFLYRPPRLVPAESAIRFLEHGFRFRDKAGLVAASVTDHPEFDLLRSWIRAQGKTHSVASLRLDQVSPELLAELRDCGHRTLTLAPEAGTERLRRVINKPITDRQIMAAMEMVGVAGFPRLKLYFQLGLPFETDDDLAALPELVAAVKKALARGALNKSRATALALSVNPFVPKPGTPFQWHPFSPSAELKKKLQRVQSAVKKIGGIAFSGTSVREALAQALIAKGDRRISAALAQSAQTGRPLVSHFSPQNPDLPPLEWFVHRPREKNETLPWDFIEQGVTKNFLWKEYEKSQSGKITPACQTATCRICGACEESKK